MTDHRAEAEENIQVVLDVYRVGTFSAETIFTLAQVHATLALVDATNAQTAAMERIARAAPGRAVGL